MMKWALSFLAVVVACLISLGAGWYQSQQLTDLRTYASVLRQENVTIRDSISQKPPEAETAAFPLKSSGDTTKDASAMLQVVRAMVKNPNPNIDESLAVVDQFAKTPSKTLKAFLDQLLESNVSEDHFKKIEDIALMALVPRDPESVLDHVVRSPYDPHRFGQHVSKAIKNWTARGHQHVTRWLEDSEPSAVRDNAIASFCRAIGETDPQSALTWAEIIEDPTLRGETLTVLEEK